MPELKVCWEHNTEHLPQDSGCYYCSDMRNQEQRIQIAAKKLDDLAHIGLSNSLANI